MDGAMKTEAPSHRSSGTINSSLLIGFNMYRADAEIVQRWTDSVKSEISSNGQKKQTILPGTCIFYF